MQWLAVSEHVEKTCINNGKKCLECSEMKEYAKIFYEVFSLKQFFSSKSYISGISCFKKI